MSRRYAGELEGAGRTCAHQTGCPSGMLRQADGHPFNDQTFRIQDTTFEHTADRCLREEGGRKSEDGQ